MQKEKNSQKKKKKKKKKKKNLHFMISLKFTTERQQKSE